MPNFSNRHDIYERIFNFIVDVLRFIDRLSKTYSNQVISNQLTRSVTSMGANSQEADGASSKKDFLHCFTITRKETKETIFWLKLIQKLNSDSVKIQTIIQEGSEINSIVSSIIKKTLENSKAKS